MSFREKLNAVRSTPSGQTENLGPSEAYKQLKGRIHLKLLEQSDLSVRDAGARKTAARNRNHG
jgi:pilus assembly protein CpaF